MSTDDPTEPFAEVTAAGVTYQVVVPQHATDYIQGTLMRSGAPYEPVMLAAMAELLAPGDLVLDVGANIGNHTLYLAHVAKARVIAFEPDAGLAAALRRSVALGGLEGIVEVHAHAVGAARDRGRLGHRDEANLGGQVVEVDASGDVEIAALDELELDQRVCVIKIDVEGMELDVLAGAERLVNRDRPWLFVEAFDRSSFEALAEWMLAHDYCYDATFNATPTHRFRPGNEAERELSRTAMRLAAEAYDLRATAAELKRARNVMGTRTRELLATQAKLVEAHGSRLAKQKARSRQRTKALKQRQMRRIRRLRARLAATEAELETLRRSRAVRAAAQLRAAGAPARLLRRAFRQ